MAMERLNSFSVVVTMLLACWVTFLSPGLASRVLSTSESEAPGYYDETDLAPIEAFQDFPPEPLATDPNSEFLEVCSKRLTPDCGESIFKNVFADDSMPVEDNCCLLLVSMGRTCHNKLVDNTINKIPDYKSNETITRLRSVQIWNKCALLADNAVPQTASPIED
ncbi:protein DOWN-REGULATED IN DIF1 11-like [Quercus lobata]|uniref:protein DOWN-REGULATED IN DIF1 11-like n=1 Tax=Quercus lobata TaxID=97700 RepID=UPI0012445CBC|nr:protein DOWN-REGULATED IN DIF1 11-like [Quercus lobata]